MRHRRPQELTRFATLWVIVVGLSINACAGRNDAASDDAAASGDATDAKTAAEREQAIDNVWHRAKLRGVAFRAVGQEPGWHLEITNGEEILLVTDYGQKRSSLPFVEPVIYLEERRTQYVIDDRGVTVEIRGEPCIDVMSGEEFTVSVSIIRADDRLEGCGRALF